METPEDLRKQTGRLKLWTAADLEAAGLSAGMKVAVAGVLGPIYASGTEAMRFYPGFAVERIEPGPRRRAAAAAPPQPSPPPAPVVAKPPPDPMLAFAKEGDETTTLEELYAEAFELSRQIGDQDRAADTRANIERFPEGGRRTLVLQWVRNLRKVVAAHVKKPTR